MSSFLWHILQDQLTWDGVIEDFVRLNDKRKIDFSQYSNNVKLLAFVAKGKPI